MCVFHPLTSEPEVDANIKLLAVSAGVMAVYKPANLPMHESGYYRRQTLAALVASHFGEEWAPVHRLDRETSGIVVCAATAALRRQLSLDFETPAVDKRYLAIVQGSISWTDLTVNQPLSLEINEKLPRTLVTPNGVASCTEFSVLERKKNATLIQAKPLTGRANQIRVHAAWAGPPLLGDKLYQSDPSIYEAYYQHGDTPEVQRLAGFARHALHATAIKVEHPATTAEFAVTSPLPQDLQELWESLPG